MSKWHRSSSEVNFSAKIDFSVDDGLKITEIHKINRIEPVDLKEEIHDKLNVLSNMHLNERL